MADFHTYTVLVVDDNPLNLKLIEKALSKEGYEIFCADNGPRARQITVDILPDLILLDIDMPGEDGFAVLEKLKGNHLTNPIPVIFLTGITGLDAKIKGFDLGAVDYITKPFHPREVLARVRIHLRLSIATNLLIRDQARKLRQVTHAQEALLPNPAADPQARYSVFYQSCHEAGGDFYDILDISNNIRGYFVADSAGHDIETSYITASVKALLAQNCTPVYTPLESIQMINEVLVEILPPEKYLTACYVHLNRLTLTLTLINAGHPPAIFHPKDKPPLLLKTQGDVLGSFKDARFGIKRFKVRPGDRIFLFSDGLVERGPSPTAWGRGAETLLPLCRQSRDLPYGELPDHFVNEMFGKAPVLEDDIVLLCTEV